MTTRERITVSEAAPITGKKVRTLQMMCARGEIPGAAKLGGTWQLDLAKLRRWIRNKEQEACRKTSMPETASGGADFNIKGASAEKAYERAIGRLP
jgi:excisionase family DNA binding protein